MGRRPGVDGATLFFLSVPPLLWAGNTVVGRLAVGLVAPLTLNAIRWALAGLLLLPFTWRAVVAHRAVLRREWRVITLLGFCGIGSYNALQYLALTTSTPTNVTLIASAAPVFTLAMGAAFFSERLDARRAIGAVLSIVGVLIVLLHGDPSRFATLGFVPGDLFMLGAAVIWSIYTWTLRLRRPDLPILVLLFAQIATGSVFAIAFGLAEAFVFGVPSHFDAPRAWLVLAYVAVLPSIVAYICWDRGVKRAGTTLPMFFLNLTPVFAAVMSTLLLAEGPQAYHLAGLVFILGGIWLVR